MDIRTKRVYEQAAPDDGKRLLVDRLWPRGVSREKAALDGWPKDLAPSRPLREWFGHRPEHFEEFKRRYRAELGQEPAKTAVAGVLAQARTGRVTLLYGAKNPSMNQAVVLREYLLEQGG